ncbi:MAG: hypothetical protein LBU16_01530 [Treponema sp.]|jgi:hypothetical protein|nr:hypothetical protein [Treponema sp.]
MAKVEKSTKSGKALDNLKKLYSEQTALNKKILAAEKLYATELKAEVKVAVKPPKAAKPGRKTAGVSKAPVRRRSAAAGSV